MFTFPVPSHRDDSDVKSCLRSHRDNYVTLFRERRKNAACVLERMFVSDDPEILTFLSTFLWIDPSVEDIEEFWSAEFPQALLGLITDRKWYEGFRRMVEVEEPEYNIDMLSIAWQFVTAVECLGLFTTGIHHRPRTKELEQFCRQFPPLWGLLWEYRDVVFSDVFYELTESDSDGVAELRNGYFFLYNELQDSAPPLSTHLGHVSFFLWLNNSFVLPPAHDSLASYDTDAIVISSMLRAENIANANHSHANETLDAFFQEVVPVAVGSMDIAQVIRRSLLRGHTLYSTGYKNALNVISCLVGSCPVTDHLDYGNTRRIAHAMAAAVRQYECHGCIDGDEQAAAEISSGFIRIYAAFHIHSIHEPQEHDHEAVDMVIEHNVVYNPYNYNFVGLVAEALVHAYLEQDDMCREVINLILQGYFDVAKQGRARPIEDPVHLRKYCYLRRVLQAHWLPVLDDLHVALRQGMRASSLKPAVVSSLQSIIGVWEDLGLAFNLSDRSREHDLGLTNYVTGEEKLLGCFNAECPCYGQKPLHGTRRICTGCWAVFYCGRQCQQRDWQAGHKVACERRKKPPTV